MVLCEELILEFSPDRLSISSFDEGDDDIVEITAIPYLWLRANQVCRVLFYQLHAESQRCELENFSNLSSPRIITIFVVLLPDRRVPHYGECQ
jgi:hypothetical protein